MSPTKHVQYFLRQCVCAYAWILALAKQKGCDYFSFICVCAASHIHFDIWTEQAYSANWRSRRRRRQRRRTGRHRRHTYTQLNIPLACKKPLKLMNIILIRSFRYRISLGLNFSQFAFPRIPPYTHTHVPSRLVDISFRFLMHSLCVCVCVCVNAKRARNCVASFINFTVYAIG